MSFSDEFKRSLFQINEKNFETNALAAFNFQYRECDVYQKFCEHLNKSPEKVKKVSDIPFLPIEFFKSHAIKSGKWKKSKVFKSSGTTSSSRSHHFVRDIKHYHLSAQRAFESIVGDIKKLKIVAILPSYQQQGDSSLISMVDHFISYAKAGSGYFLYENIEKILQDDDPKLVIGVSYALLDLAERNIPTANAIIMETGGMKGRKKEITRKELHHQLKNGFGVGTIWSEYGMTELFSQAYGTNGQFTFPKWAKCLIRDINDPFSFLPEGLTGGINVIDLANIDTCCFIETKDLGKVSNNHFEVLGRFDNSDIRGCNLMF